METGRGRQPGSIALAGSGEYTNAMNEADSYLIERLGGAKETRVALLPTASGLEPGMPEIWNERGRRHFAQLGVTDIRSTMIIDRAGMFDPEQLELLRDANFFYLSGGNPQHVIESLRDTPAWEIILAAYAGGAALGGCSAGAMALAEQTLSLRRALAGEAVRFEPALGVVPHVVVFPHFDRTSRFIAPEAFEQMLGAMPPRINVLGIDEDTALLQLSASDGVNSAARWKVFGRQTVSVYTNGRRLHLLHAGEEVEL